MNQFGGLLLNGRNDLGMAMAGGDHGDARREVEKLVAVNVFNANAAAALGHQRIRARIAGRDQPRIGSTAACALGPGKGQTQFRSVLRVNLLLGHLLVSSINCCLLSGPHWRTVEGPVASPVHARTTGPLNMRDHSVLLALRGEKRQARIFAQTGTNRWRRG